MKHLFKFYCIPAFLLTFFQLNAQTHNGGFVVRITGNTTDWKEGTCGWGGAYGWGGTIDKDTCASFVWLYDKPDGQVDSLGCDTVINDYTGKWVLIRRGGCEFGFKAYRAQLAGAAGVIILNHYNSPVDNDCTVIEMGAGDTGFQLSIPAIFASRKMGEALQTAILNGNGVGEVCFRVPRVLEYYTARHYITPLSQVDTISTLGFRLRNTEDIDLTNIQIFAEIENPLGETTFMSKSVSLPSGKDSVFLFDKYMPAGGAGVYKVKYYNSYFTDPTDIINTEFLISQYTFGHDVLNVIPGGIGPEEEDFEPHWVVQNAGLYYTGPNGGVATFATFGIGNVSIVATPDPTLNIINVILYDADANNDGAIDLINDFDDLNNFGIVGISELTVEPFLTNDALINVSLSDLSGNLGVHLKPRHPYYLSLRYDGTLAGTGYVARFTCTKGYSYFGALNAAGGVTSATPVFVDQLYDGYEGFEIIERLQLDGFPISTALHTRPTPLSANKFNITPNPATDFLKLDLNLDAVNTGVSVSLMDYNGRTVQTQTAKNFRNGQFRFDTAQLPSGNYLLWISTGEGSAARPVAICH